MTSNEWNFEIRMKLVAIFNSYKLGKLITTLHAF